MTFGIKEAKDQARMTEAELLKFIVSFNLWPGEQRDIEKAIDVVRSYTK